MRRLKSTECLVVVAFVALLAKGGRIERMLVLRMEAGIDVMMSEMFLNRLEEENIRIEERSICEK